MFGFLKKPWFWIIVILVVGGGGFVVWQGGEAKKKAEAAKHIKPVETPYAAIGAGKADIEGGVIEVAARRQGIVTKVMVNEGDQVKEGQVLAELEQDDPKLALDRSIATEAQGRAQSDLYRVQLATAKREYERIAKLVAAKFIAPQKIDEAEDQVKTAQANLAAQEATNKTLVAATAQARYQLDLTEVKAPVDGRIARRYANPGSGASTLNVSVMFDLLPNTQRLVRAEITEADLPQIFIGQEVELVPEADQTKVYPGKVLRRSGVFGGRKLQSDDPTERPDERVVEVVVSADSAPFLVGQRVLAKFMKPGHHAGEKPPAAPTAKTDKK